MRPEQLNSLRIGNRDIPVILIPVIPGGRVTRSLGPGETVTVTTDVNGQLSIREDITFSDESGTHTQVSLVDSLGDFMVNTRDQGVVYQFSPLPNGQPL